MVRFSFRLFLGLATLLAFAPQSIFAQTFELLVTQTPPGTVDITNPVNWGGVLRYSFTGTGASAVAGTGIGSASLSDPSGLAFLQGSNQLFVGNRRGNTGDASFTRFDHDPGDVFTGDGSFTATGLLGVHQIAISPNSGELFTATFNNGVHRFGSPGGVPTDNGVALNGTTRGVAVSPDGNRLYVTTAGNTIRQFDLTSNTELTAFTVTGASNLHFLRFRGNNELYAADFGGDQVFRLSVASNNLTNVGAFSAPDAISLAFSPDLDEMFVSSHQSSTLIRRFSFNGGTDSWDATTTIDTGVSMGDIITIAIPEPASAAMLFGAFGLLVYRRRERESSISR